jgi:FkbM family methyltransferase
MVSVLRRLARNEVVRRTALPLVARALGARTWTVRRGEAAGLRIATGGSNPAYVVGMSEPQVQRAIVDALEPGGVFFDVGANVGFFTLIGARAVGRGGRVLAFEPNPAAREVLRNNLAANALVDRVSIFPWALGSEPGRATLTTKYVLTAHLTSDGDLAVEVRALDDLDLPAPDLVKIDVEGEEESVIDGMRGILEREKPVLIVETHGEPTKVPGMLEAAGYGVTELGPDGPRHLIARRAR